MNPILEQDLEMILSERISWDKLKNKTVLITGASGMVGSYMMYTLLKLNDLRQFHVKVIAVIRNVNKIPKEIREREDLEPLNFNFFKIGLGDVLYNPRTTEYFVPNTGQKSNILGAVTTPNQTSISKQEVEKNVEKITNKTLNGAQTQSLISIIQNFQSGALTLQQATNIISVAIGISKDEASELIGVAAKGGEEE